MKSLARALLEVNLNTDREFVVVKAVNEPLTQVLASPSGTSAVSPLGQSPDSSIARDWGKVEIVAESVIVGVSSLARTAGLAMSTMLVTLLDDTKPFPCQWPKGMRVRFRRQTRGTP